MMNVQFLIEVFIVLILIGLGYLLRKLYYSESKEISGVLLPEKQESVIGRIELLEETMIKSFADIVEIDKSRDTSITKLFSAINDIKKKLTELEFESERQRYEINLLRNAGNTIAPQYNPDPFNFPRIT